MKKSEHYTLTLKPLETGWQTRPELRLRAALKRLLRDYGLRCIECRPAEAAGGEDGAAIPQGGAVAAQGATSGTVGNGAEPHEDFPGNDARTNREI